MCKIKSSLYEVFFKVMLTKYCTVEQKKRQGLKTHVNSNKKQSKEHGKQQNVLKPMRLCTKTTRTPTRKPAQPPGYSHPGGPAIRITVCMRPHSFASLARTTRNENEDDTKSISRLRGVG